MSVVQLGAVSFGYGEQTLFRAVTFLLNKGDRAALVAPNGAGKTTLLRVIAGELPPDEGTVVLGRDVRVGYYRQSHELRADGTVRDALLEGFGDVLALRAELTRAQLAAASGTAEALTRLGVAMDRYQLAGGDEIERRVDIIAGRLGFREVDLDRSVESLSGGERGRLRLGATLVRRVDLLLLDEPTNHLDLRTIEWLEQYLRDLPAAVLCVSHDRAFLDSVCTQTLELGRRTFRVYPLRYSDYVVARQEELERERERVELQKSQIAKTEDFIRRNMAGQKTKQAQSRQKMLAKLDRLEQPEDVWAVAERVRFRFVDAPRSGDIVLEAQGLSVERGGRRLFSPFDLLLRRGDRVGVIGANGCGKSSLLELLAGRGQPTDRGAIRRGTNLREGYYDQHLGTLDPARSALEEIRSVRASYTIDAAREYLARFRFWGDDPFRRVGALSGGESARLSLAKLLLEPLNLLFLDEPTNHLDIPAAEILEEALCDFAGTLLVASHDRRFLETVTTRIIAFRAPEEASLAVGHVDATGGAASIIELYDGNFAAWVEQCSGRRGDGAPDSPAPLPPSPARGGRAPTEPRAGSGGGGGKTAAPEPPTGDPPRRVARRAGTAARAVSAASGSDAYEERKRSVRELERKRRRVGELERLIAKHEEKLERMRDKLREPPGENWLELGKLAAEEQATQRELDELVSEWARLGDELGEVDVSP